MCFMQFYYVKVQYMIQSVFRWLNKCSLFHKRLHTMSHRNWFSWQHKVLETGSDVVMPVDVAAMATEWQNNNIHPVPCGCFDTDSCPALSYLNVLMKRSYNKVEIFFLNLGHACWSSEISSALVVHLVIGSWWASSPTWVCLYSLSC